MEEVMSCCGGIRSQVAAALSCWCAFVFHGLGQAEASTAQHPAKQSLRPLHHALPVTRGRRVSSESKWLCHP